MERVSIRKFNASPWRAPVEWSRNDFVSSEQLMHFLELLPFHTRGLVCGLESAALG